MKIKHLTLHCANLQEQKYFYTEKFRFEIAEESDEHLTLKMGSSLLTFKENRLKKSYYHFALNIPYNSIKTALKWLYKRADVIPTDDGLIKDFSSWQALAIYFLDPAGNIVEFIGRKRIKTESRNTFNEKDVIAISEVGLPVSHVKDAFDLIHKASGIPKFDCDDSRFCACGSDSGLFIIVDKAEKSWFPTDEPARAYPLEVVFHAANNKKHYLSLNAEMLTVD